MEAIVAILMILLIVLLITSKDERGGRYKHGHDLRNWSEIFREVHKKKDKENG